MCVNRRKRRVLCQNLPFFHFFFLVVRVLPSTLLPGFIGPESSVLPVNLPPSAPCPASGSPLRLRFYRILGNLESQRRRASLGKTHYPPCIPSNFTAVQSTGYQTSPIHAGLISSPLPYSWFAVRYVHRFCLMLPSDAPFLETALALLALPFRPVTAGVLLLPAYARSSDSAPCQAHVKSRNFLRGPHKGLRSPQGGTGRRTPCTSQPQIRGERRTAQKRPFMD